MILTNKVKIEDVNKKIPSITGFATSTALNAKTTEIKYEVPDFKQSFPEYES